MDQNQSEMALTYPRIAEGDVGYSRLWSTRRHRPFLPEAGQKVLVSSLLRHPVRIPRAITDRILTHDIWQHLVLRRILHHNMFSYHIRCTMDIPTSGFLWP